MSDSPWTGVVAGCALSGGRTDLGLDSPLTEEARKDSLRNGRVVRDHTAVSLFCAPGTRGVMGERDTEDQDAAAAREQAEGVEEAKEEMAELEEGDPPEKLED